MSMKAIATLPVLCCGPNTPPIGEVESVSLAARFRALADPTRVAIVNRLAAIDECCVCDLNAAFELSQPTISHHLKVLRDAGLVESTRGAHGGYALVKPPEAISMSEVLRALEGPLAPMICATDEPNHDLVCDRTSTCTVNFLWVRVRDAIAGALDTMTLADLVPARRPVPASLEGATTQS